MCRKPRAHLSAPTKLQKGTVWGLQLYKNTQQEDQRLLVGRSIMMVVCQKWFSTTASTIGQAKDETKYDWFFCRWHLDIQMEKCGRLCQSDWLVCVARLT